MLPTASFLGINELSHHHCQVIKNRKEQWWCRVPADDKVNRFEFTEYMVKMTVDHQTRTWTLDEGCSCAICRCMLFYYFVYECVALHIMNKWWIRAWVGLSPPTLSHYPKHTCFTTSAADDLMRHYFRHIVFYSISS